MKPTINLRIQIPRTLNDELQALCTHRGHKAHLIREAIKDKIKLEKEKRALNQLQRSYPMPTTLSAYSTLQAKCNKHNINLVLPQSLTHKRLCIVGESLGKEENENEAYFIGKAGKLLNKLLRDVGLIRFSIHITNVVKVQPPANKVERLNEIGLSRDDFIPYLKEELERVRPNMILALGKHAMEVLTGKEGILNWRGSEVDCKLLPGVPVMLTLHPSYLQRGQMALYPYVRHDVKVFAERGFNVRPTTTPYNSIIDPSLTQALEYLHELNETSTSTVIDIETVNKERITCIGFSKNPTDGICIHFRH